MEHYLIDYARSRGRLKRGGDRKRISLTIAEGELKNIETVDGDSLEELLNALTTLENVMPRAAEVVRLRYISGHTIKQTAIALDISDRTVVDDWEYARAYLRKEMSKVESMTLDNDKARELFNAARNLPSAEREPFLDKECGDDDGIRDEVETLLSHYFTSANTEDSDDGGGSTIDYEVGDTIGKFKIMGVLGEGGMGIVYLAEQSKPVRRRVALKVIKAGMDTKASHRSF